LSVEAVQVRSTSLPLLTVPTRVPVRLGAVVSVGSVCGHDELRPIGVVAFSLESNVIGSSSRDR
jgi:hypothetical protein